jgi:hypothetical protein
MGLADRENKRKSVVSNLVSGDGNSNRKEDTNQEAFTNVHYKITTKRHKDIKRRAIEEGKKDYEIVQEALDAYFSDL